MYVCKHVIEFGTRRVYTLLVERRVIEFAARVVFTHC